MDVLRYLVNKKKSDIVMGMISLTWTYRNAGTYIGLGVSALSAISGSMVVLGSIANLCEIDRLACRGKLGRFLIPDYMRGIVDFFQGMYTRKSPEEEEKKKERNK